MKIIIKKENLPMQPQLIARQAGYGFIIDRLRGKESFVRHFGKGRYPRFHLYISYDTEGRAVFDLHLDQKQASYAGSNMHSGEYGGEVVEAEIRRIKIIISKLYRESRSASHST
jgi:hypothetical protein